MPLPGNAVADVAVEVGGIAFVAGDVVAMEMIDGFEACLNSFL